MATAEFYSISAKVLSQCYENRGDLTALLDPQDGFAPRLSGMCRKRLNEILENARPSDSSQEEIDMLRLESNTWDLLQSIMSVRKTDTPHSPTAKELLKQNPFTPTATLAQAIVRHTPLLKELIAVREWLHDTAPAPHAPEIASTYWRFTKLHLLQAQRMVNKKELETLVNELDPDSPSRNGGKRTLAADDANYERALAQALYGYIRAGRLKDALDLCKRTRRPWRAASIRGSLLFQWKAIANEAEDDNSEDAADFTDGWSGNKRRKLWKTSCTRAALDPLLSEPDRILYASLVPSPTTSVVLKSACRTWEDHLWAQVSIIVESKGVDEMIRVNGGDGYWEGGMDAVKNTIDSLKDVDESDMVIDEEHDKREWESEVVETLESLATVGVAEGLPAANPFHVSQLHIILNKSDKLLNEFAADLQSEGLNRTQSSYPTLIRFFAHLCLFLQMIDTPAPIEATQIILEEYLRVLEESGQREHIAMYASALGDNAIERYAVFLSGLELTVDIDERRAALKRAKDHNLDVIRVARATADKTMEFAFSQLPQVMGTLPSLAMREAPLTGIEWYLIRSIEWTTFLKETYRNALEQANVIFRYFLGRGKVQAAKALLPMLPSQLKSMQESRGDVVEFYHYLEFFTIWDLFDKISEVQLNESSFTTKGSKQSWLKIYKALVDEVRQKIVTLLTMDWLISDQLSESSGQRQATLSHIRHLFIPELIIRLHAILVKSGDKLKENYKHAIELVTIVADTRYRLFADFLGSSGGEHRLNDYLEAVRQAVLKSIDEGGSDLLVVLRKSN